MPTPPTLVAFAEAEAAVNTGVNVTTASVSWLANDVIVVLAATPGGTSGETLNTPTTTGSGISFAQQQLHNSTGTDCGAGCWAAVASSGSSGTFSFNYTHPGATSRDTIIGVYVFRGSAGIGNSVITATPSSASTVALTPAGADGSVCWIVGDWNASATVAFSPAATAHGSGAPGPSASPFSQQFSPNATYYIADLDDQASGGSNSYGIASGTGPFTIIAIEVKAAAGGGGAVSGQVQELATKTHPRRYPARARAQWTAVETVNAAAAAGAPQPPQYLILGRPSRLAETYRFQG